MADGSLARRYAKALVALAVEADALDAVGADLDRFARVMALDDGALRATLTDPSLTLAERKAVLDAVLGRLGLREVVGNFLRLVLDKGRMGAFDDMVRAYGELADERAGRVRAAVITARPIDEALRVAVRDALQGATGRTVLVRYEVDADIIGGMVARVGDVVYDASVAGRLEELSLALGAVGEA